MVSTLVTIRRLLRQSWYANVPQETAPIQVLRVVFGLEIVLCHTLIMSGFVLNSHAEAVVLTTALNSVPAVIYTVVDIVRIYAVDPFFFISGFFMASALTRMATQNKNTFGIVSLICYFCNRWLRLVPMYFLASMLAKYLGNPRCINKSELFMTANFMRHANEYCLIPGWSTISDLQQQAVILLIAGITRTPHKFRSVLPSFIAFVVLARAVFWLRAGRPIWPPGQSIIDFINTDELKQGAAIRLDLEPGSFNPSSPKAFARLTAARAYDPFYFSLLFRIPSMLLGCLVYSHVQQSSNVVRAIRSKPLLCWCSVGFSFVAMWVTDFFFVQHANGYSGNYLALIMLTAYVASRHALFSGVIALVVVLTCTFKCDKLVDGQVEQQNKRKEKENTSFARYARALLVNPITMVLSRLSYAIYLIHCNLFALVHKTGPVLSAQTLTQARVLILGVKLYVISGLVALALSVLEQLFFALQQKTAKLSTKFKGQ